MVKKNSKKRVYRTSVALVLVALVGLLMMQIDLPQAAGQQYTGTAHRQVDSPTSPSTPYYGTALPSLLRIFGALLVVIAAIYLGLYALKRLTMRKYNGRSRHLLEVLETAGIAPKKTVSLIRVADKAVLVGMTDTHITVLTELDRQQTEEILAVQHQEEEAKEPSFAHLLKSWTRRMKQVGEKENHAVVEKA